MLRPFVSDAAIAKCLNDKLQECDDNEDYCHECGYDYDYCECDELEGSEDDDDNDCSCARGEACSNCKEVVQNHLTNVYTGHIDNIDEDDIIEKWTVTKKGRLKPKSKVKSKSAWSDLL